MPTADRGVGSAAIDDDDEKKPLNVEAATLAVAAVGADAAAAAASATSTRHYENNRTPSLRPQHTRQGAGAEISRLTDEVELNGDSGSDDGSVLLSPLPSSSGIGAGAKHGERRFKLSKLACCRPYWLFRAPRLRCSIM